MAGRECQRGDVVSVGAGRFRFEGELREFAAVVVEETVAKREQADTANGDVSGRLPFDVVNEIGGLIVRKIGPGGLV
jgi:hypothetical protein